MNRASDDSEGVGVDDDDDDSDEESEEDDIAADDDSMIEESAADSQTQKHFLDVRYDEIRCRCINLLNLTLLRPMNFDNDILRRELIRALDSIYEHELRGRAALKITEDVSIRQPSLDKGGLAFWDQMQLDAEQPTVKGKEKKTPAVAGKKKTDTVSLEQVNGVYKFMYDQIIGEILHAVEESFMKNDHKLELMARKELEESGFRDLTMHAMLRKDDFNDGGYQGSIVFIDFDDNMFREEAGKSAFACTSLDKFHLLQIIQDVIELGARAIVLIYENTFLRNGNFENIDNGIQLYLSEYLNMEYASVDSFAQLSFHLDDLQRIVDYSTAPCPVFLMANVANPRVVPVAQEIVNEDSLDTEIIPCGYNEYLEETRLALSKQYVEVIESGRSIDISPDPAIALNDVFIRGRQRFGALWINSCHKSIYPTAASILGISVIEGDAFISSQLRETLIWAKILLEKHYLEYYRSTTKVELEKYSAEHSMLADHLNALFPLSQAQLQFMGVIGGELRPDKFQLVDRLIDFIDVLAVTGEVAIPFIAAMRDISFFRMKACDTYREVALQLLKKARMRGVILLVPVDLIVGDTEIGATEKLLSEQKIDPTSRDDGAEYDGDSSVFKLDTNKDSISSMYVYDIGPESIHAIDEAISKVSLVLVWGTAGVCESSSFQSGQRALVESVTAKEESVKAAHHPCTLILGESTVEWFARFYDADGEITGGDGDLVKVGAVSYSQRSNALAKILCLRESNLLSRTRKRASLPSEWTFHETKISSADIEDDE